MIDNFPLRVALCKTLEGLQIPPDDGTSGSCSPSHLEWMRDECLRKANSMPVDKISRWVGYIQGVLAAQGHLDVAAERDRTRPFFHEAYEAMGLGKSALRSIAP
jgi:hypothetical protein